MNSEHAIERNFINVSIFLSMFHSIHRPISPANASFNSITAIAQFQCIHPRSLRPAGQGCQPVSECGVRALGAPNLFNFPDLYSFYSDAIYMCLYVFLCGFNALSM